MDADTSSYDVYLWQDDYGFFRHEAVEVPDGLREVRLHEGRRPIFVIPKSEPQCWNCGKSELVMSLRESKVLCGACGHMLYQEVYDDRRHA